MWNYRICKHTENGEVNRIIYDVREVFFNFDGTVNFYSSDPYLIHNILDKEYDENITEQEILTQLQFDCNKILLALEKPVLNLDEME
jgi:hypothetical protein